MKHRDFHLAGVANVVVAWCVAQVLQGVFKRVDAPDWQMKTVQVLWAASAPFAGQS
jgi:hypothetical protein